MTCTFEVGQKVQCIKDLTYRWEAWNVCHNTKVILPQVGSVYIIRRIDIGTCFNGSKEIAIMVKEIHNEKISFIHGIAEPAWPSDHFRPLQSTETGMAVLRKLQIPTKVLENVK